LGSTTADFGIVFLETRNALMRYATEQTVQLRNAMLVGFTPTSLASALRSIGRSLIQLAPLTNDYEAVVDAVIQQAESAEWIDGLVATLKRSNPDNAKVAALPDKW
jgi:hypothetical protein